MKTLRTHRLEQDLATCHRGDMVDLNGQRGVYVGWRPGRSTIWILWMASHAMEIDPLEFLTACQAFDGLFAEVESLN